MTGNDLVKDVLQELRVLNATEAPSGEDADLVLGKLNRILDNWNAEIGAAYCHVVSSFTLTPGLNPHTIGPSGATWTATRPVSIDGAALLVDATTRLPIRVHSDSWRMGLIDPQTTGDPTDLDYVADSPIASIYFYPIPSGAQTVELLLRVVLAALTFTADVTLPPGYHDALVLTTAESTARIFTREDAPASLVREAAKARARIKSNNYRIPRISTRDDGMPGGSGRGNIYTGRSA